MNWTSLFPRLAQSWHATFLRVICYFEGIPPLPHHSLSIPVADDVALTHGRRLNAEKHMVTPMESPQGQDGETSAKVKAPNYPLISLTKVKE